jgi:hypothetical protein
MVFFFRDLCEWWFFLRHLDAFTKITLLKTRGAHQRVYTRLVIVCYVAHTTFGVPSFFPSCLHGARCARHVKPTSRITTSSRFTPATRFIHNQE